MLGWACRQGRSGGRRVGVRRRARRWQGLAGTARGLRAGVRQALAGRWARVAWALGARPGQGCALGTLGLFLTRFDSILFLSRFLDIVCEPGS